MENRDFSSEFVFNTSKSGGPGGQNVNKLNTKVELRFNVNESKILTQEEKEILTNKLINKINVDGELILVSQSERSQLANKEKVIEKFYQIITKALTPAKKRKPTKPTRQSKEERLEKKRISSGKKELRRKPEVD